MHETYRMLGKAHEADLEREAEKLHRAAEVRGQRRPLRRLQALWGKAFSKAKSAQRAGDARATTSADRAPRATAPPGR